MQEIHTKIDQAISKHHDWLKGELDAAVGEGKTHDTHSSWLTANRDAVEKKLELSRQETSGENWQHLQAQVRAVLTGTFVRPAVTEIKWGDEPKKAKIEFGEDLEIVSLAEKIAILKPLLQQHSSGGSACVPTCYAYMQILGQRMRNPVDQQKHLARILNRWRTEFKGQWMTASEFIDSENGLETVPPINVDSPFFGLQGLDTLLQFWSKPEYANVFPRFGLSPAQLGKRENRFSIISTTAALSGRVISVENNNPFWNLPDVDKPPKVGDSYSSAGLHALLVIDCELIENQDLKQALFTLVDPQTGTVFQSTAQEIYAASLNHFHERFGKGDEARKNIGALNTSLACGTCWVGKTD